MTKLKKRLLIALTLFCSFFALTACSETKIADKPENSAVYDVTYEDGKGEYLTHASNVVLYNK